MNRLGANNGAVAHDYTSKPGSSEYLNYVQEKQKKEKQRSHMEFVFADEKMLKIREVIHQIANANVPVLISGESGTGKEVVAKMIHACSQRKQDPFVTVNCSSLPANLLEAELFGYEEGPYGNERKSTMGKFEIANTGTILLDDVTEIDPGSQARLLRALQDSEIERIGSKKPVKINTRVIATTSKDIAKTVTDGEFRQDLFYRLYVIHLEIPPLRERKKDIEVLTRYFLKSFSMQFKGQAATITADGMQKLVKYSWPGNVRELQNVIQRAVIMANNNIISADEFVLEPKKVDETQEWIKHLPIGHKMREVETHFILETLKSHNGNRTHSAKTLGISLRTLRNKINEFIIEGFEVPQPTSGKPI